MSKKDDSQQKTLLQFWNKNAEKKGQKSTETSKQRKSDDIIFLDTSDNSNQNIVNDDDDDLDANDLELIKASETMLTEKSRNSVGNNTTVASTSRVDSTINETINRSTTTTMIGEQLLTNIDHGPLATTTNIDTTGFDYSAGSVWIYPNNMPIRVYQYNIIQQCLYKNTMVVLPTGLGKTFVAAVVMLNFYRWYPNGKVIFMAPTKPLVNQQSDACCKIVGITKADMCQMTGQMNPDKRKTLWTNKRVFFLTPQVISNDILRGNVDVSLIKLVVIDEAHKALGEYAFCKVVESINETNKNFRVVALTATPGSDAKTVQGIIHSLLISHIELRSDDSIDIQQYNHGRHVSKFIIKLEGEILNIKNAFSNVMKSPLKRLEINRIISNKDPNSLSKLFILDRRDQFRKNPPSGLDQKKCGFIESDFAILISMIHALELLTQYGVKSFYMFVKSFIENIDNSKSSAQASKFKNEIMNNDEMAQLYNRFKDTFDNKDTIVPKELRHPKLLKLEEVIIEHFKKFDKTETRVMIFSQYRESVYEITEMLSVHTEIKAMEFVGQSGVNGTHKTVTQKEQLEVVRKFRDGGYNTLVSTCVGEEGLDIGEVDLIICYDSQKSPIRLIQRMGRTGRKREGRIVILLTEGKEVTSYECSLSKKKSIYKVIQNGTKNFKFYSNNPLMIPRDVKPTCHKIFITAPLSDNENDTTSTTKKKSKKKSLDTDNQEDDDDDDDFNEDGENLNKTKKITKKTRKSKENQSDESTTEDKSKRKRLSKNETKLADETKIAKRKSNKKSTLTKNELSNYASTGSTQLPDLDLKLNSDSVEGNLDDEEQDDDLKFLKNTNNNLIDVMSTSITSNKSINKPNDSKNNSIEANKSLNDFEKMIIDETVAFINEDTIDEKTTSTTSPLGVKYNKTTTIINESILITQKIENNENTNNRSKLIIEDTFVMSCNSSSTSTKSNSTIDQIIEDALNQTDTDKDIDKNKENLIQFKQIEPVSLIDKKFSHLKKSPVGVQNSTSTPMRSILKNRTNALVNNMETSISYSPLILSQAVTEMNTKLNKESNLSMVGMTQALDILSTCPQTPKSIITNVNTNHSNYLNKLPFKFYFKSPDIISFEMKTDLFDLFKEDSEVIKLQNNNNNNSVRFSSVTVKNSMNQESIICIDSNVDSDLKDSKKRLRFDESPQKQHNSSVDDDDSIVQMKRKKIKRNILNDSSESSNGNNDNSFEKDYNEALGNNDDYMQKYADDFESESDNEDQEDEDVNKSEESVLDTRDIDYKKKKRKREMKKAAKFIDEQAEESSCDDCDVSEDETDEDDEYDLKDSMIDRNHYSHDESAMALYHRSLKNVQFTKEYMNRPMRPITDDIFSQAVSQTEPSQYVHDSFCVSETDEIVYEKKNKKKKKKKEKNKNGKLRRLKILEESQASNSLICLSSSDETEKHKLGNSSYEIFGTNPNESNFVNYNKKNNKKRNKNVINSITEEDEEEKNEEAEDDDDENDDDLLLVEAEANLSRNKDTPNKSNISSGYDASNNNKKNEFVPDIDSESEDFNNWLSNDIQNTKKQIEQNEVDTNKKQPVFSIFNKPAQILSNETNQKSVQNSTISSIPIEIVKNSNWIIVDTSLLASAADVIQNLKKTWDQDKIIIQSSVHCDFVISQRYALLRFKWSDISAPSNRENVIDRMKKARSLYTTVMLLIQDDRETNLIKTRSRYFDSMLANLTEASFILFSKFKTEEICNQLSYLSKTESTLGFGIEFDCGKIIESKKRDLNFYLSLPNISIINALYACNNYETISKFLNSSIQDLVLKLKINDKKAKQLLKFLNLSENS